MALRTSESARVVATRFSSAKPAPDGACVRSPSTHQRPSGPRPRSKAIEVQEAAPGRRDPGHRPQIFRAGGDELRRDQPFGDQPVVAVDVGEHTLQKLGALREAGGDPLPFGFLDQQGHMGQRPGALVGAAGAVDAVIDAGVVQIVVGAGEARADLGPVEPVETVDQRPPRRADDAGIVHHLVDGAGMGAIDGGEAAGAGRPARSRDLLPVPSRQIPAGRLRSRVSGKVMLRSSGGAR